VRAARGLFRQFDSHIIDSLPGIQVPTLVVVGADHEPLLAGCHYMARKIPNAELVVVPKAGHAPNLDQPDVFNAALRKFLDGVR
jgi:pimeloyl-ACP methyl ester carboxylesterase